MVRVQSAVTLDRGRAVLAGHRERSLARRASGVAGDGFQ